MIDISTPAIAAVAAHAILLQRGGRTGGVLRWDAAGNCWRWSDPLTGLLYNWPSAAATATPPAPPATAATVATAGSLRLSESACALAACASGRLLLGQGKRLGLVELPAAGSVARTLQSQVLLTVDAAEPRTAISDGCTDRAGNFVFGTANTASDQRPIGSFYQHSQRHGLRRLALPVVVRAAGIAFSADGTRMVFADGNRILHCTYDADRARVGNVTTFAESDAAVGAAVFDSADCLWSIQGAELVRYDAGGAVLCRIALEGAAPVALAFGGDGLAHLLLLGNDGALYGLPSGLIDSATAGIADTRFDDMAPAVQAVG
ncbi:SMP-30/gluconolactonase/LRE family protein [Duganella sp. FT27W]|uniref:SMP-30/gluconolactonase/LRE family protein n=1 Tax=Duganella sp. FT27W TaxID=2654636 RepID=UPI00128D34F6|nr:SMP-30/gluconolactonase/LRE family protein [Duganella sp. FT27W]MPQ57103.1 SMP-30/gluconolactonase/LRE family protein [Duganella sp. FT27W]